MMRLKSTVKHDYTLHLRLEELNNIPQLSGSVYCKLVLVNHRNNTKFQDFTKHVEIKNNKSHINYELVKDFRLYQDMKKNSVLDFNLYLEFYSTLVHQHHEEHQLHQQQLKQHHKTKLGSLKINLIEFLKHSDYQTVRYLLQDSKINSILKLSIYWSPVSVTNTNKLQQQLKSPTLPSPLSISETVESHDFEDGAQIDSMAAKKSEDDSNNKVDMVQEKLGPTNLGVGDLVIQDERLLEIVNQSFQIPWNDEYDEFSPKQCVNDIFDKNGPGFKRNEEGTLLVDLYSASRRPSKLQLEYISSHRGYSSSSSSSDEDSNEEDGLEDLFLASHSWRQPISVPSNRHSRDKYSGQIDERELRPDLKSWKV